MSIIVFVKRHCARSQRKMLCTETVKCIFSPAIHFNIQIAREQVTKSLQNKPNQRWHAWWVVPISVHYNSSAWDNNNNSKHTVANSNWFFVVLFSMVCLCVLERGRTFTYSMSDLRAHIPFTEFNCFDMNIIRASHLSIRLNICNTSWIPWEKKNWKFKFGSFIANRISTWIPIGGGFAITLGMYEDRKPLKMHKSEIESNFILFIELRSRIRDSFCCCCSCCDCYELYALIESPTFCIWTNFLLVSHTITISIVPCFGQ